jgi:hypothetical protein
MTRWPVPRLAALLAALAMACAHAPPPPPSAPPSSPFTPEQQRALAGTWLYGNDPVEGAALELGIQRSVSGLFSLAQGIAAESLRAHVAPRPELTIAFEGNAVRITLPGEPVEGGTLDGPAVLLTNRFGDESQTTFRIEQGNLLQRGTSSGGSGVTTFTADPDGQTLRVVRRVESDQLSAPLQVTYTYRRKSGANSS